MSNVFLNIVPVTIVLGFMILIHEWGHFIAARLLGVRVDVFAIGFGPRIFGFRRGDTDYRLCILPFGGYVKMAGDNPSEENTGAPDEFLSKPRWQRVVIAVAGPAMNIIFALVVTLGLFMVGSPEPAFMNQSVRVAGILPDSAAAKAGLQPGDVILKVNGHATPNWEDALFEASVLPGGATITLLVDHDGSRQTIELPGIPPPDSRDEAELLGYPREAVIVGAITPGHPADKAGLQPGDVVTSVNGQPMLNRVLFTTIVKESAGKSMSLVVDRSGQPVNITLTPSYDDPGDGVKRWSIGITFGAQNAYVAHSFVDSARRSVWINYRMTRQIMEVLAGLFEGKVSLKQLAGPVGIAPQLGQAAKRGFADLLDLTALISLNLGILNLLPIPILDGGHVLLLVIEGIRRRDLSLVFKERFVQVGLVFLLGIIVFITYNDILKLLPGH